MRIILAIQGIIMILAIICLIGWVKNTVKFTHCDFQPPYKCEIVHGIGLLPPIGAITGWLDEGK